MEKKLLFEFIVNIYKFETLFCNFSEFLWVIYTK